MYKLALVKEACYQDLWVCEKSKGLKNLLHSTLLRTGPIGLLDVFNGDFFIVETNKSKFAKKLRKKQVTHLTEKDYEKIENTRSELFEESPLDIAKSPDSIDWHKYDIIISINFAVPIKIRKKYKNLVWICLPGEGKYPVGLNSWDYLISHNCPSSPCLNSTVIDMPYTLLSSNFLIDNFNKGEKKNGLYFEVNSFNTHWPTSKKKIYPSLFNKLNIPLRFHDGDSKSHINKLISSKYFIKYKGRSIRGNSFIEAISSECVCFLSYSDCYGKLNLPSFCYYYDLNELIKKVNILEKNDNYRLEIIAEQKLMLNKIMTNVDLQFEQALARKRNSNKKKTSHLKEKFFKLFSYIYYSLLMRIKIHGIDSFEFIPPMHE